MVTDYIRILKTAECKNNLHNLFLSRFKKRNLTRDEDEEDHFSVFYLVYDPIKKLIWIGKHRKAGLYLPGGGHIDKDEVPFESLLREFKEELGLEVGNYQVDKFNYLSITDIDNPGKQTCKRHYDIWYFVGVDKNEFDYDKKLSEVEFTDIKWIKQEEISSLNTSPAVIEAVSFLKDKIF